MIELVFGIIVLSFLLEYVDASLGMGYGTTLTPILLLLGYEPLSIIPAVLLSQMFAGFAAAALHHKVRNVDLRPGSKDFKVAVVLGACSVAGVLVAVAIAITLPAFWLKLYIGLVVAAMGAIILWQRNKTLAFSWRRLATIGIIAAFNKGASGGGYGPLVTGGQMLSGVRAKAAVGITSFAESLTSLTGVIGYLFASVAVVDWSIAPSLASGALLSVPFSVYTVKIMKEKDLKTVVGLVTLALGSFTIYKVLA